MTMHDALNYAESLTANRPVTLADIAAQTAAKARKEAGEAEALRQTLTRPAPVAPEQAPVTPAQRYVEPRRLGSVASLYLNPDPTPAPKLTPEQQDAAYREALKHG